MIDDEQLTEAVALAIFASAADDDEPWDLQDPGTQAEFRCTAKAAIGALVGALTDQGFRVVPPGAVYLPKTDEEAAAMKVGVDQYMAAKTRKPGLIGSVAPGLVLPGQVNGRAH